MPKNIKNIYMPDFTKGFIVTLFLLCVKGELNSEWMATQCNTWSQKFIFVFDSFKLILTNVIGIEITNKYVNERKCIRK